MKPVVSIVIPTYNRSSDLRRALKSVMAQTFTHWEVLVVDNHSTDDTDAVVMSMNDPRIRLFKITNGGVIGASRNRGIRNAEGRYIAFLDSDDWWSPVKLHRSVSCLEEGADVVFHDMFIASKPDQTIYWRKDRTREVARPVYQDLLKNGNALKTSSVVARKNILDEIGGYSEDPGLIAIEDFDAWLRMAVITERFQRIPQTLGYYWVGGGNVSNPARMLNALDAFEKRYAKHLCNLDVGGGIWWLRYSRMRAEYRIKNYSKALGIVLNTDWRRAPWAIRTKVLATAFLMRGRG